MRLSGAASLTLLVLAGPASAQSLLPDAPLTTLLKPQQLDRSRPLLPQESVAGTRPPAQTGPNGQPCRRPGSTADGARTGGGAGQPNSPTKPSGGGGGGPGEYARYMPGAVATAPGTPVSPTGSAGSSSDSRSPSFDRPLYGGTNRPLWGAAANAGPGSTAKPAASGKAAEADESAASSTATASGIPRDRPLWADSSQAGGSVDLLPLPPCPSAPPTR